MAKRDRPGDALERASFGINRGRDMTRSVLGIRFSDMYLVILLWSRGSVHGTCRSVRVRMYASERRVTCSW